MYAPRLITALQPSLPAWDKESWFPALVWPETYCVTLAPHWALFSLGQDEPKPFPAMTPETQKALHRGHDRDGGSLSPRLPWRAILALELVACEVRSGSLAQAPAHHSRAACEI